MVNIKGEQSPFYKKRREVKKLLTKFNLYQPAAIDNSLDSYQIIHKLIHEMNLIIDEVNSIDSKANEYTDRKIAELNAQLRLYINELNAQVQNHFETVEAAILANTEDIETIENDITDLTDDLAELATALSETETRLHEEISQSIETMTSYVDLQIQLVKELIEAQNPYVIGVYGRRVKLQNAVDEMKNLIGYEFSNVTIKAVDYFFNNGFTYYTLSGTTYTKNFRELTISNVLSAAGVSSSSWYIGGSSDDYIMYFNLKNKFSELVKYSFPMFLQILYMGAGTAWASQAQSQIPVMFSNIHAWFKTMGFGSFKLPVNSTYSDFT